MAIVRAVKTGNWSDTTVWNTGALPTSSDDVYSNTFTVTIDTSPTVLSISNAAATGVTAGGSFVPNNGITLTVTGAGVVAAGATCFTSSLTTGQSCAIVGNVTGGTGNASYGAANNSTGTINITGNVTGGSSTNTAGVLNNSSGTVNITGSVTGGSGGGTANAGAATNASTGTINITGTITGGTVTLSYGALNRSTGTINHTGTAQASATTAAIGDGVIGQITILTGPLLCSTASDASSGVNPCIALRWFPADTALSTFQYQMRGATTSGSPAVRPARNLYLTDAYAAGYPAASNVRSGTTYGAGGSLTGTCAVPGASSVVVGVPVDNTVGTAAVTASTIRAALGMNSANLDTQLAAIPTTAAPTAAAIRTEMDANSTKLANLDATVSSRSTYSGADTSGTTTLLSRLTSTRAAGLDNLDATVSSRLATSGYTAPPSASNVATAVWAAATRTLTTAIDNSATIAAAVWSYATGRTITGGTVDTLTNAPTVPSAEDIATEVWTTTTREITGGTVDMLTNAPDVPTPEEIASEVWSTTVREVTGGTVDNVTNAQPVDAAEIAEAVRTELAPELARLSNASTTQEVAGIVQDAFTDP